MCAHHLRLLKEIYSYRQAHGKSLLRAQHKKVKELMESTQKLSLNDDGSTGTASTASDDGVDSDISARDSPQEYEQSIGVDCEMDMAYDGNEGPLQLTSSESHLQISVGESNFIVDLKPRHDGMPTSYLFLFYIAIPNA